MYNCIRFILWCNQSLIAPSNHSQCVSSFMVLMMECIGRLKCGKTDTLSSIWKRPGLTVWSKRGRPHAFQSWGRPWSTSLAGSQHQYYCFAVMGPKITMITIWCLSKEITQHCLEETELLARSSRKMCIPALQLPGADLRGDMDIHVSASSVQTSNRTCGVRKTSYTLNLPTDHFNICEMCISGIDMYIISTIGNIGFIKSSVGSFSIRMRWSPYVSHNALFVSSMASLSLTGLWVQVGGRDAMKINF